jgi:hypothetical protein
MRTKSIAFLGALSVVNALVLTQNLVPTCQRQRGETKMLANDDTARRRFLWGVAAALVISPQVCMAANVDPLEAFGKSLSTPRDAVWPHVPSPLPSRVKSAAELTAIPTWNPGTVSVPPPITDLRKALDQAEKKKQVDPRTHG